jgi:hypothetical protein
MNDGGPAFPCSTGSDAFEPDHGMSLRDYFAAKAMQGLHASYTTGMPAFDYVAQKAYLQADAMLAERSKGQP